MESIGVAICSVEVDPPSLRPPTAPSLTPLRLRVQVPPLFTENFDYQFFYPDFVNGILTSDLLGKTICCTIIGEGSSTKRSTAWAGVVGNTRSYDEVRFALFACCSLPAILSNQPCALSKAILTRRVYPFAPDENMPDDADRYEQRRGRVYLGKNLELSRSAPPHPSLFSF